MVIASYLLIAGALLLVMWHGLLPGLLCVCIGFLATRRLARGLDAVVRASPHYFVDESDLDAFLGAVRRLQTSR